MDAAGQIRCSNRSWQVTFGFAEQMHEALHPDEAPRWAADFGAATNSGRPYEGEYHFLSNGRVRRFLVHLAPGQGAVPEGLWIGVATEVERLLGSLETGFQDEYERLAAANAQTEVALRLSGQQFHSFFEHAAIGMALIGLTGEILVVNETFANYFGYSEAELLSMTPRELRHPEDSERIEEVYGRMLAGEINYATVEARYLRRSGGIIWLLSSISLVRDSRGHPLYFTASLQDITPLKVTESELRRKARELETSNAELKRSNADLERFAYVASHDLQEPLRKIRIFGTRLGTEADNLSPRSLDYVQRMMHSAERMQRLIEDVLAFSRLRSRAAEYSRVDLNEVLNSVREELEESIEESQAHIEVGNLPILEADRGRLRQLFMNLLSNALKFHAPEASPHIEVWAKYAKSLAPVAGETGGTLLALDSMPDHTFFASEPDGCTLCRIWVRDHGVGFEPSQAERLFEVFSWLHSRQEFPGNGIGLAICRRVVEEHGGRIEARGELGQGAVFVVTLPLARVHEPEPAGGMAALTEGKRQ
jgi:PAS domain S-box-containing protein